MIYKDSKIYARFWGLLEIKNKGKIKMIRYAEENDFNLLEKYDKHIDKDELKNIIRTKRILVMFQEQEFVGWLRFNLFWDNIPFMNMLYLLEGYRRKGYGSQLVEFWENEMLKNQYDLVITSTQSNEQAQVFYRSIGYIDCGALLLPEEPLEIIFLKKLKSRSQ